MKQETLESLICKLTSDIQKDLMRNIDEFLTKNKITRTDYGHLIGATKGYVSQLFNSNIDHKLSKLILLSLSIGKIPVITFKDIPSYKYLDNIPAFEIDPSDLQDKDEDLSF